MTDCSQCGKCCNYITLSIHEPEDDEDYDEIVWFLMHKGIKVYIAEEDDDWYVEIETPCKHQAEDGRCMIYEDRPNVCREHDPEECEHHGDGSPYKILFREPDDFISYLRLRGKEYDPKKNT